MLVRKADMQFGGKHRFYEGYSGALILKGVPYKSLETIRDTAKPYETIVE